MAVVARLGFSMWIAACLLVSSALLAFHLIGLPVPPLDDPALENALARNTTLAERQHWRVVHVVYARCPCSNKILEHLLADPRPGDLAERVVLVDGSDALRARVATAGFIVDSTSPSELRARWQVEAAPLLIVADPAGRVRYVGGYTDRPQGPLVSDLEIIEALRRGDHPAALPSFGCAISSELRQRVDPLGVKRFITWLSGNS